MIDIQIGQIIGGCFEIVGTMSTGTFATVYRARHLGMNRVVALKVLNLDDSQSLTRFQREARILAQLSHVNICQCYLFGVEGDKPYLALELLEAPTLRSILLDGKIDWKEACRIVIQICTGLQAAHDLGIVHRDIKPENIVIMPDGTVKILDFGLSAFNENSAQKLTQAGMTLGTPQYMSPEQCAGSSVDSRADIYSVGCLLFECVTGEPPFPGIGTSLLERHAFQKPESIGSHISDNKVPPGLDRIVQKTLEKQPERRYQTAESLSSDLTAVLFNPAFVPPKTVRFNLPMGQKSFVGLGVAACGALIVSIALLFAPALSPTKPKPIEENNYDVKSTMDRGIAMLNGNRNDITHGKRLLEDLIAAESSSQNKQYAGKAAEFLCMTYFKEQQWAQAETVGIEALRDLPRPEGREEATLYAFTLFKLFTVGTNAATTQAASHLKDVSQDDLTYALSNFINEAVTANISDFPRYVQGIAMVRRLSGISATKAASNALATRAEQFFRDCNDPKQQESLCLNLEQILVRQDTAKIVHQRILCLLAEHQLDAAKQLMEHAQSTYSDIETWPLIYELELDLLTNQLIAQRPQELSGALEKYDRNIPKVLYICGPNSDEYLVALWHRARLHQLLHQPQKEWEDLNACESIVSKTQSGPLNLSEIRARKRLCEASGGENSR